MIVLFKPALLRLFCLLLLGSLLPANAHEIRPAIIDINILENGDFNGQMKLNLEVIIAGISSELGNTDKAKNADEYTKLRGLPANQLIAEFKPQQFSKRIQLRAEKKPLLLTLDKTNVPPIGDIELPRDSIVYFSGALPSNSNTFDWQWDKTLGDLVLRVNGANGQALYTDYIIAGEASGDINVDKAIKRNAWQTFRNYLRIGFEHILPKGLDHILFVVGIFLLSANFRTLLWQLTGFTLAHSVTLALGILGIITVPASIVEPLIAASIVYVCIENIYLDHLSRWRPYLIFAFGLLHGLGFASVLMDIGIQDSHFITSLVAFNVGVELGQITVIIACFAFIGWWFRHKPWYRQRITIPLSILIALIGTYWFVERVFL